MYGVWPYLNMRHAIKILKKLINFGGAKIVVLENGAKNKLDGMKNKRERRISNNTY